MLSKIASVLAAATFLIHFLIGGGDSLGPMLATDLTAPAKGAMHACWHIVSFMLAWSVFVFWTSEKNVGIAKHFAIVWFAAAIVFIYVGLNQGGIQGLIVNPQWTILLVTGRWLGLPLIAKQLLSVRITRMNRKPKSRQVNRIDRRDYWRMFFNVSVRSTFFASAQRTSRA